MVSRYTKDPRDVDDDLHQYIINDVRIKMALQRSLIPGVSARTHKHNRGYGLDNIVSTMSSEDSMRIISNDAFLSKSQNKEEVVKLPYNFNGTLIDFTISTDSFDELEMIDELNFG